MVRLFILCKSCKLRKSNDQRQDQKVEQCNTILQFDSTIEMHIVVLCKSCMLLLNTMELPNAFQDNLEMVTVVFIVICEFGRVATHGRATSMKNTGHWFANLIGVMTKLL